MENKTEKVGMKAKLLVALFGLIIMLIGITALFMQSPFNKETSQRDSKYLETMHSLTIQYNLAFSTLLTANAEISDSDSVNTIKMLSAVSNFVEVSSDIINTVKGMDVPDAFIDSHESFLLSLKRGLAYSREAVTLIQAGESDKQAWYDIYPDLSESWDLFYKAANAYN